MKDTRIEILRDGIWQSLELATDKAIRYNAVINQIGKVATREISHSNTFSLPYTHANVQALGLNVFNPAALAKSLNAKYLATYYIENKVVRTGYLVINNTNGGTINVNFIDKALELLDKWGATSYKELLEDTVLEFPADTQVAIDELIDYDMDPTSVLTPLSSQIGTRGYPLALFPNNLNAIGDDFQKDENGVRQDDSFNPYQSRPIFNVKAFFDTACEAYGYTPIYDTSVNWDNVELTYMIESSGNENGEDGTQTVTYTVINGPQGPWFVDYSNITESFSYDSIFLYAGSVSLKPSEISNWTPPLWLHNELPTSPHLNEDCIFVPNVEGGNVGDITFYCRNGALGENRVYFSVAYKHPTAGQPIVWKNVNITGTLPAGFTYQTNNGPTQREHEIVVPKSYFNDLPFAATGTEKYVSTWTNFTGGFSYTAGTNILEKTLSGFGSARTNVTGAGAPGTNWKVEFYVEAYTAGSISVRAGSSSAVDAGTLQLGGYYSVDVPQTSALSYFTFEGDFEGELTNFTIKEATQCDELIGTMLNIGKGLTPISGSGDLYTMRTTEEYIPAGTITYDEQGQYNPATVDLRHGAPRKSIKELIAGYMHKEGILMDINGIDETVKFFNYGLYKTQRDAGNFSDWSSYFLKHAPVKYDTDYGNNFGKKTRIGLSDPYPGNTYDYHITNQGEESKFKDFAEDYNKVFKDISNVVSVTNTNNPYFEFTNEGLGLIEYFGDVTGTLTQVRADGTTQGTFTDLPKLYNVNHQVLPSGVDRWYNLVDEAIKVEAEFLIPVDVMKELDMSEPIYVNDLGGFYIIEKIEEYVNSRTPVRIQLIKLIDDITQEDAGGGTIPVPPVILLYAYETFVGGVYKIITSTSFLNYTPVAAVIEYRKLDGPISEGGEYTGDVTSHSFTFPPYESIFHSLDSSNPITATEEGWYEIQVVDAGNNRFSAPVYKYLGDNEPVTADVSIWVNTNTNRPDIPSGSFSLTWNYIDHVPTSSVLEYYKANFTTGAPLGSTYTVNLPLTPSTGETSVITPVDGAGYYIMNVTTDQAYWEPGFFGTAGLFI